MFVHLALDGVADGSLGVGLDIVNAAARVVDAGLAPQPLARRALAQRVLSVDGAPVRSGAGRTVPVDGSLRHARLREGDVLVVPGLSSTTARSLDPLLARADVRDAAAGLAQAAARGACVAASCSATFVLAASGCLDGRQATTTWWLAGAFARRFPAVDVRVERMVVACDGALTAGSAFAHADLMLALLARVTSAALAHTVARYLVLDARPTQSRYMVLEHLRVDDDVVRAVERFIGENLHRPLSLDALARAGATSTRTLARRVRAALGLTPHALVQKIRMQHAAHLLDTTRESVDEVAARVGFADAAAFRRAFRKVVGESPRTHRASRSPARTD